MPRLDVSTSFCDELADRSINSQPGCPMSLVVSVFTNLVLITAAVAPGERGRGELAAVGDEDGHRAWPPALFEWHSWLLAAAATVITMNLAGVLWQALGWRAMPGISCWAGVPAGVERVVLRRSD